MTVIDEIAAERKRQIDVEAWSLEHDDGHDRGEMADAAAAYAMTPETVMRKVARYNAPGRNCIWPWDWKWWKPKNRRHDLIRAAALIVAEIERIDRLAESRGKAP